MPNVRVTHDWFGSSVQMYSRYNSCVYAIFEVITAQLGILLSDTHSLHDFQVKEIYNFVQDDLTTEDVLLLDCQSEIYVWIGLNSDVKLKQQALTLGLVIFLFFGLPSAMFAVFQWNSAWTFNRVRLIYIV